MNTKLDMQLALGLLAAASTSLATAQTPVGGIDLGNLTPKTPSQKAAAEATATAPKAGVPGSANSTSVGPAPTQGIGAKGATKSGIGVIGAPGSNNAKAAAAAEDTAASGNDVQVKMPSSFKK